MTENQEVMERPERRRREGRSILPFLCSCPFLVSMFAVGLCVLWVLCGPSKATARCYTSICDGIIQIVFPKACINVIPQTDTPSGGEDEENCSSPFPSRFLDENMCGIPDIHQRTPHENPEMTCPWDTEQVFLLNLPFLSTYNINFHPSGFWNTSPLPVF